MEITSNRLDQLSTRYFDESTAVDRKYPLRCKFHGGVSSGNEWGRPCHGRISDQVDENYRKTNPSVRYLDDVRENFNRALYVRIRDSHDPFDERIS